MDENKQKQTEKKLPKLKKLTAIIIPIIFIMAGIAGFAYFSSNKVKIQKKPMSKQAALVETMTVSPGTHQSYIEVMGTVQPDREVTVKSRVSGEVIFVSPNFVQGGLIKKDESLIQIDDSDYKIALQKAESTLDKALADLNLEQGQQKIAKEEFKLLKDIKVAGGVSSSDLALRKPQLAMALAVLQSARADVDQAKLNLSRTNITVPFNALVLEKHVNMGALLTSQGNIATLVDIDAFEVKALVPPDQLSAIRINEENGSRAWVTSQSSNSVRHGKVVRSTGQITGQSLLAGLIIQIPDPLGLKNSDNISPLLLNDYVDIKIAGEMFENTYKISRSYLREGGTIWVYQEGKLKVRPVKPIWKEKEHILIREGLNPGDILIISDLPAPVNGMALQTRAGEKS